ncbi:MAG: ribonuclease H-like domain-containing protein [Thermodesulfovibrionales bacterium]|nr:ribonuclease H-like domain-containing protein [Thermodesulfovibrionales bacterium]
MIRHSFSILKGIGERLERRLWQNGIHTWDDFIRASELEFIPIDIKIRYDMELLELMKHIEQANVRHLCRAIKRREHWRLYDIFRDGALCLDIETSGVSPEAGGYVTVVGLYDGKEYVSLVRGFDLEAQRLKNMIKNYKCLVTFNGICFDIPFLRKAFPDIFFEIPHFDLSQAARRIGIQGGLKSVEKYFHINRCHSVSGMNGYDAVRLWEQWKSGSEEALNLLIEYNRADTINLKRLADLMYPLLKESTGFYGQCKNN